MKPRRLIVSGLLSVLVIAVASVGVDVQQAGAATVTFSGPACAGTPATLSWSPQHISGLTGYQIQEQPDPDSPSQGVVTSDVGPTQTSFNFALAAGWHPFLIFTITRAGISGPFDETSTSAGETPLAPDFLSYIPNYVGNHTATVYFGYPQETNVLQKAPITVSDSPHDGTQVTLPDGGVMFSGLTNYTAYSFTATVSDGCGSASTSTGPIFIPKDIQITPTLPNARAGTSYDETLSAAGGPAYYWSILSGALPPGLTLDPKTGTISGSPTAAGQWTFTVETESGINPVYQTPTQTLSITVQPGFTNPSATTATVGSQFSFPVTTSGPPPARITEKGRLPRGVSFRRGLGTAILSGAPTSANHHKSRADTYPITFTVEFGRGQARQIVTQAFTLTVTS